MIGFGGCVFEVWVGYFGYFVLYFCLDFGFVCSFCRDCFAVFVLGLFSFGLDVGLRVL